MRLSSIGLGDVIAFIAEIVIPFVIFCINKISTIVVSKKTIFESNRKRYQFFCFSTLSYACLFFGVGFLTYGLWIITDESLRKGPFVALNILVELCSMLLIMYKEKKSLNISPLFLEDGFIKRHILIFLGIGIIIGPLGIGVIKLILKIDAKLLIPTFIGMILLIWSLGFANLSTLIKDYYTYTVKTTCIWTKTFFTKYEIHSEVIQKKDKISFYHKEDSVLKNIDIPIDEIARIEYILDPEHKLINEKIIKLKERKAKKRKTR